MIETLELTGDDDLRLVADRYGDPAAPAVLFLHGGGQTRHSWGGTAAVVADRGWQAVTLDSRGHGDSDWAPGGDYRLAKFAADTDRVIDALRVPVIVVGASIGGLTAIVLEGTQDPGSTRGVVFVDVIPEMEPAGADRVRQFMAEHREAGFASIDEATAAVAAYNPHRERPPDGSGLKKNLRSRDGRWYWHWDPAFLDGIDDGPPAGEHHVERLNDAIAHIDVPIMLVRGARSDLVSEAGARRLLERYPHVEYVDVTGAGHMVAGDRNDAFTDAVLTFLDRHHQ